MEKLLKGKITIGRPSYSNGKEVITIELIDENSHTHFVEMEISYENFTKALMGQAHVDCEFKTRGLDVVGLIKEQKPLIFPVYNNGSKDFAEKVCQAHTDDGWTASTYFRSQNSIRRIEGTDKYEAHGTQYRFVKPKEE